MEKIIEFFNDSILYLDIWIFMKRNISCSFILLNESFKSRLVITSFIEGVGSHHPHDVKRHGIFKNNCMICQYSINIYDTIDAIHIFNPSLYHFYGFFNDSIDYCLFIFFFKLNFTHYNGKGRGLLKLEIKIIRIWRIDNN